MTIVCAGRYYARRGGPDATSFVIGASPIINASNHPAAQNKYRQIEYKQSAPRVMYLYSIKQIRMYTTESNATESKVIYNSM